MKLFNIYTIQTRTSSFILQFLQITTFSMFLNLPFLSIRVRTSQQIFCSTCSSVLGWLPYLNSFRFLHILYTVALSTSLHMLACRYFFFHFCFPSFTSSSQSSGGSRTLHLFIPSHQILAQKLHLKNKCSLLSILFLQKTQMGSPLYPHLTNLSPVVKQSLIASHITKACLGIAKGNHISCHQSTIWFFILTSSQVSDFVYFFLLAITHIGLSQSPLITLGKHHWISTRTSDLAGLQHQIPFLKTLIAMHSNFYEPHKWHEIHTSQREYLQDATSLITWEYHCHPLLQTL